jgi:hypothetical protein
LKEVLRAVFSSLLSLLLAATLVWGGCISCEQYFMFSKGCCNPDGHCKTKSPAKNKSSRECKQIAFDHQEKLHVAFPVATLANVELPVVIHEIFPLCRDEVAIDPSPPDLQVLYSTFLI